MNFIVRPEVLQATRGTLLQLQPDPANLPPLLDYLNGRGPRAELRSVVRHLARYKKPARYLEVGVRRGWSMAQVAAECPACMIVGIDPWVPDYAGAPNPGPEFVSAELGRAAPHYRGNLRFISERSQDALPGLIEAGARFDLITVDGDHTAAGAYFDLWHCLQLLDVGGLLVFDDLVERADDGGSLLDVWTQVKGEYRNLFFEEVPGLVPVGIAERVL